MPRRVWTGDDEHCIGKVEGKFICLSTRNGSSGPSQVLNPERPSLTHSDLVPLPRDKPVDTQYRSETRSPYGRGRFGIPNPQPSSRRRPVYPPMLLVLVPQVMWKNTFLL